LNAPDENEKADEGTRGEGSACEHALTRIRFQVLTVMPDHSGDEQHEQKLGRDHPFPSSKKGVTRPGPCGYLDAIPTSSCRLNGS
jgi:hypothetical protein